MNNINKQNSATLRLNKKLFTIILLAFSACICLYLYFITQIVFNIVERKAVESDIHIAQSDVATLELAYLDSGKNISLESAALLGLKEPVQMGYATRKTTAVNLAMNNEI